MTEITLTPDAKAVASRELRKLLSAASELLRQVEGEDSMPTDHVQNLLSLGEYHFADAAKAIGVSSQSENIVAMRNEMLRDAQARVAELEAFIAGASGAAQAREGVKALSEKISNWWRVEGLGFAHDISFAAHFCLVKLSCTLSGEFMLMDSDTPVSDKDRIAQWHGKLQQLGLVLSSEGRREPDLIDCDQSRAAVVALIKQWLPSARIWSFAGRARRDGQMVIQTVEIHLQNYEEIAALPEPAKEPS